MTPDQFEAAVLAKRATLGSTPGLRPIGSSVATRHGLNRNTTPARLGPLTPKTTGGTPATGQATAESSFANLDGLSASTGGAAAGGRIGGALPPWLSAVHSGTLPPAPPAPKTAAGPLDTDGKGPIITPDTKDPPKADTQTAPTSKPNPLFQAPSINPLPLGGTPARPPATPPSPGRSSVDSMFGSVLGGIGTSPEVAVTPATPGTPAPSLMGELFPPAAGRPGPPPAAMPAMPQYRPPDPNQPLPDPPAEPKKYKSNTPDWLIDARRGIESVVRGIPGAVVGDGTAFRPFEQDTPSDAVAARQTAEREYADRARATEDYLRQSYQSTRDPLPKEEARPSFPEGAGARDVSFDIGAGYVGGKAIGEGLGALGRFGRGLFSRGAVAPRAAPLPGLNVKPPVAESAVPAPAVTPRPPVPVPAPKPSTPVPGASTTAPPGSPFQPGGVGSTRPRLFSDTPDGLPGGSGYSLGESSFPSLGPNTQVLRPRTPVVKAQPAVGSVPTTPVTPNYAGAQSALRTRLQAEGRMPAAGPATPKPTTPATPPPTTPATPPPAAAATPKPVASGGLRSATPAEVQQQLATTVRQSEGLATLVNRLAGGDRSAQSEIAAMIKANPNLRTYFSKGSDGRLVPSPALRTIMARRPYVPSSKPAVPDARPAAVRQPRPLSGPRPAVSSPPERVPQLVPPGADPAAAVPSPAPRPVAPRPLPPEPQPLPAKPQPLPPEPQPLPPEPQPVPLRSAPEQVPTGPPGQFPPGYRPRPGEVPPPAGPTSETLVPDSVPPPGLIPPGGTRPPSPWTAPGRWLERASLSSIPQPGAVRTLVSKPLDVAINLITGKGGLQNLLQGRFGKTLAYGVGGTVLPLAGAAARGELPPPTGTLGMGASLTGLQPITATFGGFGMPLNERYSSLPAYIGGNAKDLLDLGDAALDAPSNRIRREQLWQGGQAAMAPIAEAIAPPAGLSNDATRLETMKQEHTALGTRTDPEAVARRAELDQQITAGEQAITQGKTDRYTKYRDAIVAKSQEVMNDPNATPGEKALAQKKLRELGPLPDQAQGSTFQASQTTQPPPVDPKAREGEFVGGYNAALARGDYRAATDLAQKYVEQTPDKTQLLVSPLVRLTGDSFGLSQPELDKLIDGQPQEGQQPLSSRLQTAGTELDRLNSLPPDQRTQSYPAELNQARTRYAELNRDYQGRASDLYEQRVLAPMRERADATAGTLSRLKAKVDGGEALTPAETQELAQAAADGRRTLGEFSTHALRKAQLNLAVKDTPSDANPNLARLGDVMQAVNDPATPIGKQTQEQIARDLAQAGVDDPQGKASDLFGQMDWLPKLLLYGGLGLGAVGLLGSAFGLFSGAPIVAALGGAAALMGAANGDPSQLLKGDFWSGLPGLFGSAFGLGGQAKPTHQQAQQPAPPPGTLTTGPSGSGAVPSSSTLKEFFAQQKVPLDPSGLPQFDKINAARATELIKTMSPRLRAEAQQQLLKKVQTESGGRIKTPAGMRNPGLLGMVMSEDQRKQLQRAADLYDRLEKGAAVEFKPDYTPLQLSELGVAGRLAGTGPRLAGGGADSPTARFADWYRGYHAGTRTPDDAAQIARWKSMRAAHGASLVVAPSARRAFSLMNWAVDPEKLLPADARAGLRRQMLDHRKEQTAGWLAGVA